MLRSMFSAIAGLKAHQLKMDVTGNNIANVNTVGYKSSSTVFQDTLSQVVRSGGAPAADRGGTNPAQVGLGVKLAAISTNWTNGAAQSTGRSTDFMLEGDGFFVTRGAGDEQLYTRAGSLDFDGGGRLVTPDGAIVQGWAAKDGVINPNGPITDLTVPYGQIVNPSATKSAVVAGNLNASAAVAPAAGGVVQTPTKMFDSQGVEQAVTYTFTKTAANTWSMTVQNNGGAPLQFADPTTGAGLVAAGVPVTSIPVTFDAAGKMTAPTGGDLAFLPNGPSWTGPVTVEMGSVTQFAGSSEVTPESQDGFALGTLQGFELTNDGTIIGSYSNGLKQPLGQLAIAAFNNPSGLEKAGNSSFRVGQNSGEALVGAAGSGGRGSLSSGALEMSNVDLAEEFTSLIVAQRGFQANSRVITTSDSLLEDLVNLKR